jgi:hypothetical protein
LLACPHGGSCDDPGHLYPYLAVVVRMLPQLPDAADYGSMMALAKTLRPGFRLGALKLSITGYDPL